jgi:hypothetical protein
MYKNKKKNSQQNNNNEEKKMNPQAQTKAAFHPKDATNDSKRFNPSQ